VALPSSERDAMSLSIDILGRPGADNAALLTVDGGQSLARILFDCGEEVLRSVRPGVVQSVEHLCLSHFHMDHVSGFDGFFRRNYNRPDAPVNVWGPHETLSLMAHRFRSFSWNLHADQPGEWIVHEIGETAVEGARFHTREAFAAAHPLPTRPRAGAAVFEGSGYRIEARLLPHHTIASAAYRVVESDRRNVSLDALSASALAPGPWLKPLSDDSVDDDTSLETPRGVARLGDLRREFLVTAPGDSAAYLTDFCLVPGTAEWDETVAWLRGTRQLVCECHYRDGDEALALRHGHMTAGSVGRLAAEAEVGSLVLMHLSTRYTKEEWQEMLAEARAAFPAARFPAEWG